MVLARGRLYPQILQRIDPEDVTQSVFRSFFQRQKAGQFTLRDWGALWGLLVTMTIRKCGRRADEFYAARRDKRPPPNCRRFAPRCREYSPFDARPLRRPWGPRRQYRRRRNRRGLIECHEPEQLTSLALGAPVQSHGRWLINLEFRHIRWGFLKQSQVIRWTRDPARLVGRN